MNITCRHLITFALALAAGAAQAASLHVGDPAPKLQTGKFVQGDPVTEFAPGKAYIVEFWATWCGPCRASIPHLNETYVKFKDKGLVVIGQDCSEPDESKVVPFIKSMGKSMTYRVALDDKEGGEKGKMAEAWMAAADQHGIPTAFLIDTTGHVAWIGHPMTLKSKTIEEVLAGTYNAKEAAAADEKQKAQFGASVRQLRKDMEAKDWDAALTDLDEASKAAPDGMEDDLAKVRFKVLAGKKEYPAAFKILRQLSDAHKNDPMAQNNLAWIIVSDSSLEQPDLELARTMAQRAIDGATGSAQQSIFTDTMARIKFMQGNKEDAIALEQKALALADEGYKDKLQKALDSYKKGELPEAQ